jgi:hypothetical protein
LIWLLLVVALALLPFFQFFRGTPHQLAAVKQLEESLPEGVLDEDAEWFEAWKASGIEQQLWTPYYHQLDNESGYGVRECFSSAAAMVASFHGKVSSDDYYNKIRERIGDTTMVDVQVKTLRFLDLNVDFLQNADSDLIEEEITAGRPVMVGWLHKGDLLRGEPPMGTGHWSVIVGFNRDEWIMHDPMGFPLLERGGHNTKKSGEYVRVSRPAFYQRWQIEGPSSGWAIVVDN